MESYFIHSFLSGIFHLAIYVCVCVVCVFMYIYIYTYMYMYFKIHACFICSVQFTVFIVFTIPCYQYPTTDCTILLLLMNHFGCRVVCDQMLWLPMQVG